MIQEGIKIAFDFNKTPRRPFRCHFDFIMGGLIIAFPIIGYQMWRFVAPRLYVEKCLFTLLVDLMFFLVLLLPTCVTPLAFDFFLGFQQPGSRLGICQKLEQLNSGLHRSI